jgi:hypothetical protein
MLSGSGGDSGELSGSCEDVKMTRRQSQRLYDGFLGRLDGTQKQIAISARRWNIFTAAEMPNL